MELLVQEWPCPGVNKLVNKQPLLFRVNNTLEGFPLPFPVFIGIPAASAATAQAAPLRVRRRLRLHPALSPTPVDVQERHRVSGRGGHIGAPQPRADITDPARASRRTRTRRPGRRAARVRGAPECAGKVMYTLPGTRGWLATDSCARLDSADAVFPPRATCSPRARRTTNAYAPDLRALCPSPAVCRLAWSTPRVRHARTRSTAPHCSPSALDSTVAVYVPRAARRTPPRCDPCV
ncbi:hypothetical protein B0H15DRAFT_817080 [Mycena belliarum]|uniref:Uncharacterized protein n=1 Tax=Mycena belliarum TaxID=1033014 RepID=A0AAD6UJ67_9AGAR|nr:hypothetical protein B0H15DRAFT_817080 [Mycena belliae]